MGVCSLAEPSRLIRSEAWLLGGQPQPWGSSCQVSPGTRDVGQYEFRSLWRHSARGTGGGAEKPSGRVIKAAYALRSLASQGNAAKSLFFFSNSNQKYKKRSPVLLPSKRNQKKTSTTCAHTPRRTEPTDPPTELCSRGLWSTWLGHPAAAGGCLTCFPYQPFLQYICWVSTRFPWS